MTLGGAALTSVEKNSRLQLMSQRTSCNKLCSSQTGNVSMRIIAFSELQNNSEPSSYGDGEKFWGYVGTNAEQLYIILYLCAMSCLSKLFNLLLLINMIKLYVISMITSLFWSPNFISWLPEISWGASFTTLHYPKRFSIKYVLNIRDMNMAARKYWKLYKNLFNLEEFITWGKERRLWFQSLIATC
jgi:hypothetical protein